MTAVFHLDLNACTGCQACRLACTIENELDWGRSWRRVSTYNPLRHPDAPLFHITHACYHCADAPCARGCPTRAIRRDEATGALLIWRRWCIGCGYCEWACPYGAPLYDEDAGVMTKCTLCHSRLVEGLDPACAALCPTGALRFGDAEERDGIEHVEGFPPRDVGPAARFVPLRADGAGPPGVEGEAPEWPIASGPASPSRLARLRAEWPLVVFTLVAAGLVGWLVAGMLGTATVSAPAFLVAGAAAMLVSTLHLGRRTRPWLVLRGLGSSWISREIVAFGLFLGLAAAYLLLAAPPPFLGWAGVIVGLAALFCIDRVYDVVIPRRPVPLHSADTLPTALLFAAVLGGDLTVAGGLALLKLVLYLARSRRGAAGGSPARVMLRFARVTVGLLAPAALWFADFPGAFALLIVAYLAGEVIDRLELYADLEPDEPVRQMERDLEQRLQGRRRASSLA